MGSETHTESTEAPLGRLCWLDIILVRRKRLRRRFEWATRVPSAVTRTRSNRIVHDQEERIAFAALGSGTVIKLVKLADLTPKD